MNYTSYVSDSIYLSKDCPDPSPLLTYGLRIKPFRVSTRFHAKCVLTIHYSYIRNTFNIYVTYHVSFINVNVYNKLHFIQQKMQEMSLMLIDYNSTILLVHMFSTSAGSSKLRNF